MKRLLWAIHLPAGLLLILSAHTRYISPADFWPAAFLGLGFMLLLFVNILFLLIWVLWWSRRSFFALLVLALSYPTLARYITISFSDKAETEGTFRVMTYNVRVFDLYDWNGNKQTRDSILDLIEGQSPDILCIQEYFDTDDEYFPTREPLVARMKPAGEHVFFTSERRKADHWGIATFSRFPVVGKGVVELPDAWNNACIFTDVVKDGDTLRIYNLHLASIGLSNEDYKLMEQLNNKKDEKELERTKGILTRVKAAFIKRAGQAGIIRDHIATSPYPVVVAGDFNDTPSSYAYRTIRGPLKDAFVERGTGLGVTYTGMFPGYRIDFLFASENLQVERFRTHRSALSDHFPVTADFRLSD